MLVKQYHVTVLSNFLIAYDKYARVYDKRCITESSYPDVFFLLSKEDISIGVEKANGLLESLPYPDNRLIVIETTVDEILLKYNEFTGTGLGRYIEDSKIVVDAVFFLESEQFDAIKIEDVVAQSYAVVKQAVPRYDELRPRSISILPIAKGCQASCAFCFSTASISSEHRQQTLDNERMEFALHQAKLNGANRAVITGGGEPGLLPFERLIEIIGLSKKYFDKVILISNGYFLSESENLEENLLDLQQAGLTVLSISYHHFNATISQSIMNLSVNIEKIAKIYQNNKDRLAGLNLRLICVLQKGGIDNSEKLQQYIDWCADIEVEQICFKELYVSSSNESIYYEQSSNEWSYINQVSLKMLTDQAQQKKWEVVNRLPWGSPVYEVVRNNRKISVAAYTEPSVSWELNNRMARSWNLMADGRCYASLESCGSEVLIPN